MKIFENPDKKSWPAILSRPSQDIRPVEERVKPVVLAVKERGDEALREFALQFDNILLNDFEVSRQDIDEAENKLSKELKTAIGVAYQNVYKFHEAQKSVVSKVQTMPGVNCWRKSVAIQKVGIYVPGGTAPLFSTVLMLGIPAQIAGCKEVVLCSPSNHPAIYYAAKLCGVHRMFRIGGAQAIAALAYGTESVPKVSKIFGPGNQYVTVAKQMMAKEGVAIDMPAGPSEVAIFADESANAEFIAADLLSQAEHGADSQVVLVSTSRNVIYDTIEAVGRQLGELPRKEMAAKSLENSRAILVDSLDDGLELLNEYAAEHLILALENAEKIAEGVVNAGSVFIGHFTPESCGDYASGTNHTLPTNGFAKAYSGVSLDSFVKKITFQKIDKKGLSKLGPHVIEMAEAEQLKAHANAVRVRLS